MQLRFLKLPHLSQRLFLWAVTLICFGCTSTTLLSALPYGSGAYDTCTYDTCGISLTTSETVTLNVIPTADGVNTTAQDQATVATDASTGYTLSFLDTDTNTNLVNGANTIAASGGTQATPSTLGLNTWGYRVDGLSGFGAGPTSAQNSDADTLYAFAGVPASDQTAHTLKTTSSAANPSDITTIWFGVRLDTTKPAGIYTDQITYTAVTND